ncbi:hypothetical protein [Ulvibacter litoralis]|uniref:Tetratricopeptide repeat-containing protein n=1 Tax=Ulvibacter litoralis TaxID=227084 RepID=A0A1G7CV28_9FLAO|nr:hypothetical protein [Ulvibacter litoralis]GHC46199.1 hypothetical protein GCM10008083_06500 [Ulvibacter litoralis]SDE42355.1 hypothetical protein SAMN05421855_101546 [Ulvibacter litoralis]
MKKLPQLICLLLLFISFSSLAQTTKSSKIDVNKDVDIVKVYEQLAMEGYGTPRIYKELANAYYFKNEYKKAKKWFEQLFKLQKPLDATLKHRYRQTLKALNIAHANNEYLAVVKLD